MPRTISGRTRSNAQGAAGFTLIELLAVIGIIALLLALLLPALSGVRDSAKRASTEALLREIVSATQSFQAEKGRLPGFFSATEVGSETNRTDRGFTAMENMLLDLAGGVIPPDDPRYAEDPDEENTILIVGPHTSVDENVKVDIADIGAQDGPGYLSLKTEDLRPVRGQFGVLEESEFYNDRGEITKGMPDVIDAFGQPVLAWVQDPAAPVSPPASANDGPDPPYGYFAQEAYDPAQNNRAPFYWASNAGYLTSGDASASEPWGEGLGEDRINQNDLSAIGGAMAISEERRIASLTGVLGSPAFPTERESEDDPWRPARARGGVVLTSAGSDQIYFAPPGVRPGQGGSTAAAVGDRGVIGYAPSGQRGVFNNTIVRTVETTDDIIQSAGG